MKLAALALLAASQAAAAPLHMSIETPYSTIFAADCQQQSITIAAHGTVLDVDAVCPHIMRAPRIGRWQPEPHPDGAPIRFNGTIKLGENSYVRGCAVIDYWSTADYSMLVAQCVPSFINQQE